MKNILVKFLKIKQLLENITRVFEKITTKLKLYKKILYKIIWYENRYNLLLF